MRRVQLQLAALPACSTTPCLRQASGQELGATSRTASIVVQSEFDVAAAAVAWRPDWRNGRAEARKRAISKASRSATATWMPRWCGRWARCHWPFVTEQTWRQARGWLTHIRQELNLLVAVTVPEASTLDAFLRDQPSDVTAGQALLDACVRTNACHPTVRRRADGN